MLGDQTVTSFLATRDAERAKEFYRDVLGLRLLGDEPYALVFALASGTLRIQKAGEFTPQPFTALGWEVPDIHATLSALIARGVTPLRYQHLPADELGVWTVGPAQVAWFHDPDRNVLSLTQLSR
jgi:catechol 2,3-dioxygenase-like lactoylglutathione lyase family enzyme